MQLQKKQLITRHVGHTTTYLHILRNIKSINIPKKLGCITRVSLIRIQTDNEKGVINKFTTPSKNIYTKLNKMTREWSLALAETL